MTKSLKVPQRADFLSVLEANIARLENDSLESSNSTESRSGSRKVHFGERVKKRAFDKDEPALHHEGEEEEDEALYLSGQPGSDEEDDVEEDSEEYGVSEDENFDSDVDELDFDALSPAEQLKYLMEPVEDEEGEEQDNEDGDDVDFDIDNEEDYVSSEEEASPEMENDFGQREDFGKAGKSKKKLKLALGDDEEEEASPVVRSTFEKQQDRLRRTISALEEENVSEKPWMLRGEVTASARPMNSLLEQDIDFEHASRAAPIITPEVTESIEALIKQRIRDQAWDDVERKLPHELPQQKRKQPELDTEKSSKSLSQIYEDETTFSAVSTADFVVDEPTKKAHQEITDLFSKICHKLDGLSNFKFNPRAYPLAEIQLKTNKKSNGKTAAGPATVTSFK